MGLINEIISVNGTHKIQRFAYRIVWFDTAMAKSFYKLPEKEIKLAVSELVTEGILVTEGTGFALKSDVDLLKNYEPQTMNIYYSDL